MSVACHQFQQAREHREKDRISERKDELKRYVRHDSDLVGLSGDLGKENFVRSLDGAISPHVANSQEGEIKDRQRTSRMKTMSPGIRIHSSTELARFPM